MNVRKNYYQCCSVPCCGNTSIKTPTKLFIHVPEKLNIRNKWLQLARISPSRISPKSNISFCEDHFDLPNDMENFTEYHLMGYVKRVLLKPMCLPLKFACQADRRKRTTTTPRDAYLKRQRRELVEKLLLDVREDETEEVGTNETSSSQPILVADDPPDQSDTGDDLSMYLNNPKKSTKPTKTTADSAEKDTDKDADQRLAGFSCNNCSNKIIGYRYTCVQCLNYDLCASCEARGAHCLHYVLRIPKLALNAEVQSMLTAIRSHLLNLPEAEVPVEELPTETIKVEIKVETPDPLDSDQFTDDNYAAHSQEIKKKFTATEETIQVPQIAYNTATTTGIIDNTLVIIENPVLSEPESKRRRANSPPPLVPRPGSTRVAPPPAYLAPTSAHLASTSSRLVPASARLVPASARPASTSSRLVPASARLASTSSRLVPASARLVPASARLASTSSRLVPASARLVPASTRLVPISTHLVPASVRLASTSLRLAPTSARLAPDFAPGRMLDKILYPQLEEPAAAEDKEESSSIQVFSHVKKKPPKLQAKPGLRGGKAPASTSRSDDKK